MKKILLIFIIVVLFVLLTIVVIKGCSNFLISVLFDDLGCRDWRILLCEGYEIHRTNANNIILVHNNQNDLYSVLVSDYINAYRYNTLCIQLWCARDGRTDLLGIDSIEDKYYSIDVETGNLSGPYSKSEFESHFAPELTVGLGEWIYTNPRPHDAKFN